jgi:HlyD family secretion protein
VKWIVIVVLAGAAAWGGWWYWKKPREQAPDYRTATISRGDIIQAVTASGQLNPVLNVQVGSQISCMIQ